MCKHLTIQIFAGGQEPVCFLLMGFRPEPARYRRQILEKPARFNKEMKL
jgi:hypothetical protein